VNDEYSSIPSGVLAMYDHRSMVLQNRSSSNPSDAVPVPTMYDNELYNSTAVTTSREEKGRSPDMPLGRILHAASDSWPPTYADMARRMYHSI